MGPLKLGTITARTIANAATRSLIEGTDFGENVRAALPDVIGSTIGEAISEKISEEVTEYKQERARQKADAHYKAQLAAAIGQTPQQIVDQMLGKSSLLYEAQVGSDNARIWRDQLKDAKEGIAGSGNTDPGPLEVLGDVGTVLKRSFWDNPAEDTQFHIDSSNATWNAALELSEYRREYHSTDGSGYGLLLDLQSLGLAAASLFERAFAIPMGLFDSAVGRPYETIVGGDEISRRSMGNAAFAVATEGLGAYATTLRTVGTVGRGSLYVRAADDVLDVRLPDGRSLWDELAIGPRGEAWEIFDAARTGFQRTPYGFKTFDQFDDVSRVAISNKTLDHAELSYSRIDKDGLFGKIKGYVDEVAGFTQGQKGKFVLTAKDISERRLHVLLPSQETILSNQTSQLAAAARYAQQKNVIFQLEYAR